MHSITSGPSCLEQLPQVACAIGNRTTAVNDWRILSFVKRNNFSTVKQIKNTWYMVEFWNNLYQSDGKWKMWRKKLISYDPKQPSLPFYLANMVEIVLWLGHVSLPLELANLSSLIMWLLMAAEGWILKCTETSYLLRSNQMPHS